MDKERPGETLFLNVNAEQMKYLKRLQAIGLWGDTPTEVALELVLEGIRSKMAKGLILADPPQGPRH